MDFGQLMQIFGLPGAMLALALLLMYTDKIVSGSRYRAVVRQRDRLFALVISAQRKAITTANLVEAMTEPKTADESDEDD